MKNTLFIGIICLIVAGCATNSAKLDKEFHGGVKRVGMVVKVKADMLDEYKKLHADDNPGVRHLLEKYHLRNFNIFLVQLADGEWYEFGYYEYWGDDFEGDMARLDAEPENMEWLKMCDPMQEGILPDQKGWKEMDRIYYNY
jgi:L-rhamnose mutarotase